jgi:tetraacyldisaccharide 4'-kinase
VSTAFRFIVQARDKLYRSGILSSARLNYPVVSVGNLTLGGTGKTPLVIALAERFKTMNFHPVILSRGYGRTSREVLIASPASAWQEIGDEPALMMRRLKDVPVVVGADRYQAGQLAERKQLGNVFILDDGFQHRRLHRDVDIVTIDPAEWSKREALLPTGRWREPKHALGRADVACIQEIPGTVAPVLPIPAFMVKTEIQGVFKNDVRVELESLKSGNLVAIAGIAKPERFFAALEELGIRPKRYLRFRDHHRYSRKDIDKLNGELCITTEKDAVRLQDIGAGDFLCLRISANIPQFDRLMELLLSRFPKS